MKHVILMILTLLAPTFANAWEPAEADGVLTPPIKLCLPEGDCLIVSNPDKVQMSMFADL